MCVRRFFATSWRQHTAEEFMARRSNPNVNEPVLLVVLFSPTGRCMHVNFLEQVTAARGENEFLFPPYSIFTVVDVTWSPNPDHAPHCIELRAAVDNHNEPDTLPTATYS